MSGIIELEKKSYRHILQKVAENEGLTDISLEIEAGSSKGDNYLGAIYRVTAKGKRNGKVTVLNLILKTCTNDKLRDTMPTEVAYSRESFVYNVALKELEKMQDATLDRRNKFSFVKCYHASDIYMEEMIVLEDLKVQGFEMYDRLKSADVAHTSLLIKALAKLHTLSYVLKFQKPELFNELAAKCPDIIANGPFGKSIEPFFRASAAQMLTVIEDPSIKIKVEEFSKHIMENMQKATEPGRYGVLCHGDTWTNNMLFKYQNGVPVDIRLLDYQLMKHGSPATDLLYFIFSCTDHQFRAKNYYAMLDLYYDTLAESLKAHSLDINSIMSKNEWLQEVKEHADFGLGMAILTLRFFASDASDAPDLVEIMTGKEIKTSLPSGAGYDRYVERVNGVFRDFVEYGYLI